MMLILFFGISLQAFSQTADFSITKREGCAPLDAVNFTDISTGGTVTSRKWDLGKGPISNNSVTVGNNYENAGTYIITLTATFSNGETRTKKDSIIVHPNPIAAFKTDDTAGCAPLTTQLTDMSTTATGTITNWSWDIGPGNSNLQNPSYQLNVNGDYDVTLLVTNSWGCKSDLAARDKYIHVYDKVKAGFSTPLNYSCDTPFTVNFINTTTGGGAISYKWLFGDGDSSAAVNPVHTYTHPGVYQVQVAAKNGTKCTDTYLIQKSVFAGRPVSVIKATDTVCANTPVLFSGNAASTPFTNLVTWKWIFPGSTVYSGQNVSYTFTAPGTYDVLLIAYYNINCADTVHHTVTVKPGPKPEFTLDKSTGCSTPFTVNFLNKSEPLTGLQYDWNFGDGAVHSTVPNPSHTYTTSGSFTVTLTIIDTSTAGGCTTVMQKVNAVNITRPVVDFTYIPPEGCTPLPVNVTARLTNVTDPVVSYIWNFGEGLTTTTSVGNATYTYSTAGKYLIKLTIITQQGCTDSSKAKTVTVTDLCSDDGSGGGGSGGSGGFTVNKTCADKYTVNFTDTVSHSIIMSWDFGDSTPLYTSLPLDNVTHTFPNTSKSYVVTITRKDTVTNKIYTAQKRVIIIDEKAKFSPDIVNICKDKMVNFTTQGIDSSNIDLYTWDFGDSTAKTIINNRAYFQSNGFYLNGNTSHTYKQAGDFYVKLIIRDKLGCLDSAVYTTPVVVKGPIAAFTASLKTSCGKDFMVDFTDSAKQNGSVPIQQWLWNFGNGVQKVITTKDSVIHQAYLNNPYYQEYNITLTVKDSLGCQNTSSQTIKSFNPKANFTSSDTLKCGDLNVTLLNYSSAYAPAYTWYYGDGTSSTASNGSHVFTKNGIYDIKLVVVDNNGCKDSITKPAFIKLIRPKADYRIGDTSKCGPTPVNFYDSSDYASSYKWDFGDNSTGSTDKAPSHLYNPGTYPVKLYIKGVNGCTDSITKTVRIKGPVGKLNTGPNIACTPYNYEMNVTGTNISAYAWDYGDGTPVNRSRDSIVHHIYDLAGKVSPNVVLTSPEGCSFLLKTGTVIIDRAKADFIVDKNQFCDSGNVQFTDHSSATAFSSIINYKFDFGDGSSADLSTHPLHRFAGPGTYKVSLTVESLYGCKDTFTLQPPISIYKIPTASIAGEAETCAGMQLHFEAAISSQDSVAAYAWKLDNNLVSKSNSFDYRFPSEGSHHLSFTVNTKYGCEETATKDITIHGLPVPAASHDTTVCIGSKIQLHASGGLKYLWSPAADLQNANNADPIASPKQNSIYHLIVTNTFGCIQQDSVFIRIDKKVNLQHSNDLVVCRGESTKLAASGNTQSFLWTPSAGLSNPGIANPVASPKQTTIYQVVGYSTDVCPNDTGFVKITVGNTPIVNLGPDLTVDAGTPLTFNPVVSNDVINYSWMPSAGLDCSTCLNPRIIADKDIMYKLTVHTQYGCEASDDIKVTVLCGKGAIRIPNAFTPNGDGNNDVFYITGYGIQLIKRFSVYNRWGKLVFNRENILPNDKNNGWNGLVNNQDNLVSTTFVYIAEVICNEGKTIVLKGTVVLIR